MFHFITHSFPANYGAVTKTLYNRFEDVLWTLTMRQWHAGNTLGKWRTIVNVLRTHTKRMNNDSLTKWTIS